MLKFGGENKFQTTLLKKLSKNLDFEGSAEFMLEMIKKVAADVPNKVFSNLLTHLEILSSSGNDKANTRTLIQRTF